VFLKCCPADDVGTVTGTHRGRIVVDWGSLNYTGKHKPESLTLAEESAGEMNYEESQQQ